MAKIYVVVELSHDIPLLSVKDIGVNAFSTRESAEDFVIKNAIEDVQMCAIDQTITDYESAETYFCENNTSIVIVEKFLHN
jgi:hypothetical protein